jgi:lysozyme
MAHRLPVGRSGGQHAMTREALRRRAASHLLAAATVVVAFAFVAGLRLPGLGAAITAPAAIAAAPAPTAAAPAPTAAAPVPLRMSDSGLARIRGSEAFSARVYDDGAGNPTIGYGHLIRPGENFSGGITQAQAEALFRQDVERVVNPALDRITIALTQNQVDALGSFIFNVGTGGFLKNILSYLNAGKLEEATNHMLQFITGRDARSGRRQVLRGLLTRRQFEVALFRNPVSLQYLNNIIPRS